MGARTASGLTTLLLRKFALRHWQSAPRQSALLVAILALGIAVFFSIRLANRAALASFQNFTDLITQESDWLIEAPAGLLPDSLLLELRERLNPLPVHIIPVLETTAARPQTAPDEAIGSQETFQLLGVDLIGIQNLAARRTQDRSWFGPTTASDSSAHDPARFWNIFSNPNAVFVSAALAAREPLRPGDALTLVVNENIVTLEVSGIIPSTAEGPQVPATLLVMDLPAVQRLTGRPGSLSRIEFMVDDGPNAEARRDALKGQLELWSQGRWVVASPADRRESAATMTRAFRLNLTILSLLALLVGLYLIFQALDGAVVRRREEIGILRSLGVEEQSIRRVWLLEAAGLGVLGGSLGAVLGWAGAQFSVRLVGRTVNALYYSTSLEYARLDGNELAAALLLAVTASLLAGWIPARTAARTPPAQILVRHALEPPGMQFLATGMAGPRPGPGGFRLGAAAAGASCGRRAIPPGGVSGWALLDYRRRRGEWLDVANPGAMGTATGALAGSDQARRGAPGPAVRTSPPRRGRARLRHRDDGRHGHPGRQFRYDHAGLDRTDVPGRPLHFQQRRPQRLDRKPDLTGNLERYGHASGGRGPEHRSGLGSAVVRREDGPIRGGTRGDAAADAHGLDAAAALRGGLRS